MKTIIEYWDRESRLTSNSIFKRDVEIEANTEIELFEKFYKLNNNLRYCNGSYYLWKDAEWKAKYDLWLKSDDYKKKSFNLFYGGGVVD